MQLKFKLIDEQNVKIIAIQDDVEKEVGCIFTPSSSGNNIKNAIQICGASEVFDFWGCSRYTQPKDLGTKKRIINALENKKEEHIQVKDIQIMFNFETETTKVKKYGWDENCLGCFNKPCTCDNKENHKHISPYNVKRETDLEKEGRLEYLEKDGIIHLKGKEKEDVLNALEEEK